MALDVRSESNAEAPTHVQHGGTILLHEAAVEDGRWRGQVCESLAYELLLEGRKRRERVVGCHGGRL